MPAFRPSRRTQRVLRRIKSLSQSLMVALLAPSKHDPSTAAYTSEKLRKVDDFMNQIKASWLGYATGKEVSTQMKKAVEAAEHILRGSIRLGESFQQKSVRIVENQMVVDVFEGLDNGRKEISRMLRMSQQRAVADAKLSEAVARGLIEGTPRSVKSELLKTLEKGILEDGKFIKVIDKNGKPIRYRPDTYSEMVARTRLAEAQSVATIQTVQDYGGDLVRVSDHNTLTPFDMQFEGRVFSISGTHAVYPLLVEITPFHPNCLHRLSAFVEARTPARQEAQEASINESISRNEKKLAKVSTS